MKLLYFAALFVAASAKMLPTYPEDITASASQTQDVEVQGPPIWVSTKGATTINGSVMPVEATPSPGEGGSSSVASGSAVPASRSGESSAVSAVTSAVSSSGIASGSSSGPASTASGATSASASAPTSTPTSTPTSGTYSTAPCLLLAAAAVVAHLL